MTKVVNIHIDPSGSNYEIRIAAGSLGRLSQSVGGFLGRENIRIGLFTNRKVLGLYGDAVKEQLSAAGYQVSVFLVGDGERYKNFKTFERALDFLGDQGFRRSDAVLALGGGVVGDLAGFAASVYLRGIAFLQVPTTLLSMIDSSVGGKTGVNTLHGKNNLGSFYQPSGVVIDTLTLKTLPKRELTAGFCEAIKQAALAGPRQLENIDRFLGNSLRTIHEESSAALWEALIAEQVKFKALVVAGDEREAVDKNDASSRKILNFGHTLGHALEKTTNFTYLKHGEAVGYGIKYAAILSKKLDLMSGDDVNLLNDVVHRAGTLPPITHLDPTAVFESFKSDKKMANDSLRWVLLRGFGKPVIVSQSQIPHSVMIDSFRELVGP